MLDPEKVRTVDDVHIAYGRGKLLGMERNRGIHGVSQVSGEHNRVPVVLYNADPAPDCAPTVGRTSVISVMNQSVSFLYICGHDPFSMVFFLPIDTPELEE